MYEMHLEEFLALTAHAGKSSVQSKLAGNNWREEVVKPQREKNCREFSELAPWEGHQLEPPHPDQEGVSGTQNEAAGPRAGACRAESGVAYCSGATSVHVSADNGGQWRGSVSAQKPQK